MSRVVEALAWLAGIWLIAGIYVAIAKPFRDEPTPYRTADDVHRDAAIHRLNTIRQRKEDTP